MEMVRPCWFPRLPGRSTRSRRVCQQLNVRRRPQAVVAFLESTDFEDAIRNAVSIGGDSDTIACIAEAFYGGVPEDIAAYVAGRLNRSKNLKEVVDRFYKQYMTGLIRRP